MKNLYVNIEKEENSKMQKKKLYPLLLIYTMAMITAGCTSHIEETSPAEKTSDKESSKEIKEEQKTVPTLAEINTLPAETVFDAAGLNNDEIHKCFYSEELNKEIISRINNISYQENDEIKAEDLRYLRVLHTGFDGETHIGELIVNQCIAEDILEIMEELYANQYPIEKMVLIDEYNADDEASMSDNNTSAFNYRVIAGTNRLSKHGQGLAIDINPKYNPCVKTGSGETLVQPQSGTDYADRSRDFSYKIDGTDLCYRLFKEHGFVWGGEWNSLKDYQHFEWKER